MLSNYTLNEVNEIGRQRMEFKIIRIIKKQAEAIELVSKFLNVPKAVLIFLLKVNLKASENIYIEIDVRIAIICLQISKIVHHQLCDTLAN